MKKLDYKRNLLLKQLELRTKELGITHPSTVAKSQELDKVILEMQRKMSK